MLSRIVLLECPELGTVCVLPQDMANAPSDLRPDALVVYSRAEGEMIMRQVANIKMPLRGVYITGASSWEDPDNEFAEYVVTPGQWAADVRASCSVFGTNANYVELFTAKYGYEPDYKVAMSTAAGVVFQLALQQAGTSRVSKIMEALSLLSAETIAGRVRFSYQQRNIGRDPILMQYQVRALGAPPPPSLWQSCASLVSVHAFCGDNSLLYITCSCACSK